MDDETMDALLDLSHDLGKYLRLPLALLPVDAGPAEVREALAWDRALDGGEDIDRAAVTRDFDAVAKRIRDLIEEETRG